MSDTEPEPAEAESPEPAEEPAEEAAPPGGTEPADDAPTGPAEAPAAEGPARPQPPAMTPAQIAEHPTALVRVTCDGRCGNTRDLWAGNDLPTDDDGAPYDDPRGVLMAAAGCYDEPRACPGAVGDTPAADTFNAVTFTGPDMASVDLSQMVNRVRGANRDPELQPVVADTTVAPIPMVTVEDLELAANGEIRLPVASTPFDPPPVGMLAALGVDVENLDPTLTGRPPGAKVESGDDDGGDSSDDGRDVPEEPSNPDA